MKGAAFDKDWESKRLAELEKYSLDLSVQDPFLDGMAEAILRVGNTTSALITFFGKEKTIVKAWAGENLWVKSKQLFCDLVLEYGAYVEVNDMLSHPLFKHDPEVLSSPLIQFFSSTPVINPNGFVLGSLCALNRQPFQFTKEQREKMQELSITVMAYLEAWRKR